MKAWFLKLPNGDLRALEENTLKRMAIGEALEFEFIKKRNYKFLQKFFVFLKAVYSIEKIESEFSSIEHLRYALTMDAGWFEEVKSFNGEIYLKQKSISYAGMCEAEFDQFYAAVMALVLKRLPEYCEGDIHELENEIMSYA